MSHLPVELRMAVSDDEASHVRLHHTLGNGNCLFDSLSQVLRHDTALQFDATYLRTVVARSLLDATNPSAAAALQHWYSLYHELLRDRDSPHLHEYAFMAPAARHTWPLDAATVRAISDRMLDPQAYWGEEYALRVFEQQLQVRFVVMGLLPTKGLRLHAALDHAADRTYQPTHYIWLHLQGQHYQPLSYDGRFVFRPQELPQCLQSILQRAAANNGWVLKTGPQ